MISEVKRKTRKKRGRLILIQFAVDKRPDSLYLQGNCVELCVEPAKNGKYSASGASCLNAGHLVLYNPIFTTKNTKKIIDSFTLFVSFVVKKN